MDGVSIRSYAKSRRERRLPCASHQGVRLAIQRGALVPPAITASGKINAKAADAQLAEAHPVAAHLNGEPTPSHTNGAPVERLSLAETRRQREELRLRSETVEYHRKAGRLCEAAPLLNKIESEARVLRDVLTVSLPAKLGPVVCAMTPREATLTLEVALRDALAAFVEGCGRAVERAVERERGAAR